MRDERGQAVVELALVLPVLFLILMGIIDFGHVFLTDLQVNTAARYGARLAVTGKTDADIIAAVVGELGNPQDGLSVTITPEPYNRKVGQPVTVTVSYDVPIWTPFIKPIIGDSIKLGAQVVMRGE